MSSNGLSFLETEGSVGNVVLSQCDTEPAALKFIIYTPSDFKEAKKMEEIFVCEQGRDMSAFFVLALWLISTIETDVFRFIFRAFEVRETCCDAAGAASTLEMGHMDLSSSCVCVFGHGHAQII